MSSRVVSPTVVEPWPRSLGIADKFSQNYTPQYFAIAAELGPQARVLEIGIWQGHGLRLFQKLFPFGEVVGVDIHPDAVWPEGTIMVRSAQDNPDLPRLLGPAPFGLIVDDASHDGPATAATFTNLWPLVALGGYYVIEDWRVHIPSQVAQVASLLQLLATQDSDCDQITYRYGLAVVHKRKEPDFIVHDRPETWPTYPHDPSMHVDALEVRTNRNPAASKPWSPT